MRSDTKRDASSLVAPCARISLSAQSSHPMIASHAAITPLSFGLLDEAVWEIDSTVQPLFQHAIARSNPKQNRPIVLVSDIAYFVPLYIGCRIIFILTFTLTPLETRIVYRVHISHDLHNRARTVPEFFTL